MNTTLDQFAVKVDVELFDLIALVQTNKHKHKKDVLKRVAKFLLETDQISGCLLVVAMDSDLLSDLVDYKWAIVPRIARFTRTHSIPKVYKMLAVRYADDLRLLEIRIGAARYASLIEQLKGE